MCGLIYCLLNNTVKTVDVVTDKLHNKYIDKLSQIIFMTQTQTYL